MKIDLIDRKILNELDKNSRQSSSEIGKKIRQSKQVVNYRIAKLVENRIITSFYPHIDVGKLGYLACKVYFQLASVNKTKEQEINHHLKNNSGAVWWIYTSGRWDLIVGFVAKNIKEFNSALNSFMDEFSNIVITRAIALFNEATLHHRKWILNDREDVSWPLGINSKAIILDELDINILKELEKDARKQIIEIASSVISSSPLVLQRIKKLEQKGIIGAYRIGLNLSKVGRNYCKSFVYYQNKTTDEEKKLLNYVKLLKEIIGISKSIGPWDLELEFEVENYADFHEIMKELKNKFSIVRSFETVYIEREFGTSFLPKSL